MKEPSFVQKVLINSNFHMPDPVLVRNTNSSLPCSYIVEEGQVDKKQIHNSIVP
jgi:hypothetical protein